MMEQNEDKVGCEDRDKAVTNLRCLHLFYGFSPETFALSVSLLDRFLCKVKVRPKYLSCIATACYFIAVKTVEEDSEIPYATELVKLSQCGGAAADLLRMEGIILDKLDWDLNPVTTLTFVNNFYAIFVEKFPELASTALIESAVSKLEVCMCHYGFYGFQAQSLALAIFSCALQEVSASVPALSAIIDLQVYCKVSDMEFLQCRGMIIDYLVLYYSQKNKMPKEKRKWLISRRTMSQLRPTFDYEIELPTILESDDDNDCDLETGIEDRDVHSLSSKLDQVPHTGTYGAIVESLPYHNETVLPVI
ncbi:cyclin-G1-like isoform X2 [Tubulanus polymorphus]|uniref:cyclin-G1-like isoform X2 n=1 Tax=Tubulanus polymorphus TaxID=672921 RepID=UPI003DA2BDD7